MMKRALGVLLLVASATPCHAQGDRRARLLDRLRKVAVVETDLMVPMRDGVKLATDIVRPMGGAKYPVVLSRTPYQKKIGGGAALVTRGVAVAVQDCRGRYSSEGKFYPFIYDQNDAYDTIEWLARQPWCNGKVAMQGGSYVGYTQVAAALTAPPHLACIMPVVPPADIDNGVLYFGGALRMELVQGWMLGQSWVGQRVLRQQVPKAEMDRWKAYRGLGKWCRHLPLTDVGPIAIGGASYAKCWTDIIDNWEKPDYWAKYSAALRPEAIKVPVLITGGFYDIFARENIELVLALRERGGSEATRKHSHLIIGPWAHGVGRPVGDVDFEDARKTIADLPGKWLKHWLLGQETNVETWPAIGAYVINAKRWIATDTWPPAESEPTKIYLSPGRLSLEVPPADVPPSRFTFDPENPVPTRGGNNLCIVKGIRDHRANAERPDVLEFLGPEFNNDLVIAGRLRAHLHVSTSAADTDFTAMLLDVRPDGTMANVLDGIVRLRYRNGRGAPKLVTPGDVVEVDIDLWSTAYAFKKGHRIALHVSSSNFPRFDRNLNTADPPWAWTKPQKATNTVYHDESRASYIELPLLTK